MVKQVGFKLQSYTLTSTPQRTPAQLNNRIDFVSSVGITMDGVKMDLSLLQDFGKRELHLHALSGGNASRANSTAAMLFSIPNFSLYWLTHWRYTPTRKQELLENFSEAEPAPPALDAKLLVINPETKPALSAHVRPEEGPLFTYQSWFSTGIFPRLIRCLEIPLGEFSRGFVSAMEITEVTNPRSQLVQQPGRTATWHN